MAASAAPRCRADLPRSRARPRDFGKSAGGEAGVVGDRRPCARRCAMPRNGSSMPGGSLVARLREDECAAACRRRMCLTNGPRPAAPPRDCGRRRATLRGPRDERPRRELLQPRGPVGPTHRSVRDARPARVALSGGAASRPPARRSSPGAARAGGEGAGRVRLDRPIVELALSNDRVPVAAAGQPLRAASWAISLIRLPIAGG